MTDVRLTNNHDLDLGVTTLRVEDVEEIKQHLLIRLRLIRDEFFTAQGLGMPMFDILGSRIDDETFHQIVRSEALGVPGVLAVGDVVITRNTEDRSIDYVANVDVVGGTQIVVEI